MAKAGGIRAGKAYVEVGADDSPLQKALKGSQAKLRQFGDTLKSVLAGAAGGAAFAGFNAGLKLLGKGLHLAVQGVENLVDAAREFSAVNRNLLPPPTDSLRRSASSTTA